MKPIVRNIRKTFLLTVICFGGILTSAAQIPQNIDPGQEVNPPSFWQQPEYIVPIAVILVFVLGYGWWRRSKKK